MSKTTTGFDRVFPNSQGVSEFQSSLIAWFEADGKSYPWRETVDPYAILVSELMLQQTQIATVLGKGYFKRWMERFPTVEALADAEEEEVLKAWEGLGYYNRARNLQKTAREIVSLHGGRFPDDFESVLRLPGVGRYTAGAVMSFAYDRKATIVDGNVTRVLARLLGFHEPIDSTAAVKFFWSAAEKLTPALKVRQYNSAIMELGQRICSRASPDCDRCPVQRHCLASAESLTDVIPMKKRRADTVVREENVGLAVRNGKIFLTRESGTRRIGLWRLPELKESETADLAELFRFDYAITKYKVSLRAFLMPGPLAARLTTPQDGEWHALADLKSLPPMGSPYLKAVTKYQNLHDELNLSS